MSVKVAKFEIKGLFFQYIVILHYIMKERCEKFRPEWDSKLDLCNAVQLSSQQGAGHYVGIR